LLGLNISLTVAMRLIVQERIYYGMLKQGGLIDFECASPVRDPLMWLLVVSLVLAATRQEKLENVMSKIRSSKYEVLELWHDQDVTNPVNLLAFSFEDMTVSFDRASDELPEGRRKLIHPLGSVAAVEFKSYSNKYSGLFRGADSCLARLSTAVNPKIDNFVPGMALKCFIDGESPSGNIITMNSVDGQGKNFMFFDKNFSNIIPAPTATGTKLLGNLVFKRASKCPSWISTFGFAAVDQTGQKADSAAWPIKLILKPNQSLVTSYPDFRFQLKDFPASTKLWDVYGSDYAGGVKEELIGSIVTTSEFVASEYGDNVLFFQHTRGEVDDCVAYSAA